MTKAEPVGLRQNKNKQFLQIPKSESESESELDLVKGKRGFLGTPVNGLIISFPPFSPAHTQVENLSIWTCKSQGAQFPNPTNKGITFLLTVKVEVMGLGNGKRQAESG